MCTIPVCADVSGVVMAAGFAILLIFITSTGICLVMFPRSFAALHS